MPRIEDVQGQWKHRKTGKIVEVVSIQRDSFGLRHASGRQTYKAIHYFTEEYERVPDDAAHQERCERMDQLANKITKGELNTVYVNANGVMEIEFAGHKFTVTEVTD